MNLTLTSYILLQRCDAPKNCLRMQHSLFLNWTEDFKLVFCIFCRNYGARIFFQARFCKYVALYFFIFNIYYQLCIILCLFVTRVSENMITIFPKMLFIFKNIHTHARVAEERFNICVSRKNIFSISGRY